MTHGMWGRIKQGFDLFFAFLLLLVLSPALLIIAWLVRQDGGAALYRQERVGQHGKPFYCLKFRTMCIGADEELESLLANDPIARKEWEKTQKLIHDPRVTSFGRFLRTTSLDELPQLWNVLKREMSLVGPRPALPEQMPLYGEHLHHYLKVKPGMTGLWQVSGRNQLSYETRVDMDVWYVENWTMRRDIYLLFRTLGVVLRREGAY